MICIGGNYSEEHIEIWIQLESLPLHVVLRRHIKEHGQSTLIQSNIQSLHYMEYFFWFISWKMCPHFSFESYQVNKTEIKMFSDIVFTFINCKTEDKSLQ